MQFGQPILLWALTGLSIPLAIHLLSRKEGKVIRMGSLRHLSETSTQQFKGIKLNELLLLALRSLLLILFVFLISGLHWKNAAKKWLVVETGLENNSSAKHLKDSLTKIGYDWHQLRPGFPKQEAVLEKRPINNWELIKSLEQQELTNAIVLSTSRLKDFNGKRESIPENIQWITFPNEPTDFTGEVIQQTPDQFIIRKGHSQADYTSFETVVSKTPPADSIRTVPLPSIKVAIVSDSKSNEEALIIKAALLAIAKTLPVTISITEEPTVKQSVDWVFWLSENKVTTSDSTHAIIFQPQPSNKLLEQIGKTKWAIRKRLTIDVAQENNFTLQLASLLIDEKEKWNAISHHDRRTLSDSILFKGSPSKSGDVSTALSSPVDERLLLALLLVLFVERFVSYKRNQ
jgi:hypothetical protein